MFEWIDLVVGIVHMGVSLHSPMSRTSNWMTNPQMSWNDRHNELVTMLASEYDEVTNDGCVDDHSSISVIVVFLVVDHALHLHSILLSGSVSKAKTQEQTCNEHVWDGRASSSCNA